MLVDTHCHLDAAEFAADRDAVHAAALAAGVGRIIVPAVTVDNCLAVKRTCQRYAGCYPAYGIHPLYVDQTGPEDLARLRRLLQQDRPLAVGEIGLDFYIADADIDRQEYFYLEQLKLAREFDLPVLLHVRRAVDPILRGLRRIRVRGGIAHAFNGSRQQAEELIKLGFKLGFGGTLTYPGSRRIRQLATELPLASLVLETDAPDIPPVWRAGGRNDPAQLPAIGKELAVLRGVPPADLQAALLANCRELFPAL
ncbi:TatD family hydrolase [Dechloromonas sp. ZY10]|uniref:TatD family hydrolase n=1 Tax=Dechloromonas aquae TaxID=2664436 RepID=UPI0035280894